MEALKFTGGAIIVGAAVCIMLPDLVRYLAGLWRLGVLIVVVILLAWVLAVARLKISGNTARRAGAERQLGQSEDDSPSRVIFCEGDLTGPSEDASMKSLTPKMGGAEPQPGVPDDNASNE